MGWLLAALSGVIAAFTYPTVFAGRMMPELGWMAFFGWVPLFLAIRSARPRAAFARSFFAGLFHYGIAMYWLYTAMNSFGGLSPVVSVLALLLLVAVLSAYFGIIFWISQWLCRKNAWAMLWVRPFVWVGIEYLRGHVPAGGFPWSQIGYSQGGFLHFIQSADLFGVYGVTWLLVFCNEALAEIVVRWRRGERPRALKTAAIAAVLVLANLAYGRYRLDGDTAVPTRTLQVGVVQGNIPQEEKWQRSAAARSLETFQGGALALEQRGAALILWPEASMPYELAYDAPEVAYDLGTQRADILFGTISRSAQSPEPRRDRPYHNTAILADAAGRILGHYHKRHLVPFGEYVPWKDYLFFARKMTAQVGEMMPGSDYYPLKYQDSLLGVLICYEDIFPEISRIMAEKGANVLINITNDAWYGRSSAAYQHQVFSQFRAVETRRALIRATNTGLTSQIDRQGRVLWQGGLFTREDFVASLPFYEDLSPYVRAGDWLPRGSLALLLGLGVYSCLRKPARSSSKRESL
ncbi:MAG: apolipoprotein N-acyltransferase [Deltaproteobacteria bacterium]|nr:apolipoprotein N-acyltransferase [Deltaproteobacteria bacterium]